MQTEYFHDCTDFILISKCFKVAVFLLSVLTPSAKIQHSVKACCFAVISLTTNFGVNIDLYAKCLNLFMPKDGRGKAHVGLYTGFIKTTNLNDKAHEKKADVHICEYSEL